MANGRRSNSVCLSAPLAPRQEPDQAAIAADAAWDASMAREIPASKLSAGQKNAVWRHIKAEHPERRAFLEDPAVQQLMKALHAEPMFPPELIRAAIHPQPKETK